MLKNVVSSQTPFDEISYSVSLSLSPTRQQRVSPSHSTKATKARLDKVLPCSPTHHTHHRHYRSITHFLMKTRGKGAAVIAFFCRFSRHFSPAISFSLCCYPCLLSFSLTYNTMLGQRKSLIVCVVIAKGNRANMQDIYHP